MHQNGNGGAFLHFARKPASGWDYYAASEGSLLDKLASYYRVPHVSSTPALWHADRAGMPGVRHEELAADWNHPSPKGHAVRGPSPSP